MANNFSQNLPSYAKPLADALGYGCLYSPAEMFRYFLSAVMEVWGFEPWYPAPVEARGRIIDSIICYDNAVAKEEPFMDILGAVYAGLSSKGGKQLLGQYFTPWNLAVMMAKLNPDQIADEQGLKVLADPACGSGVLLLAKANQILENHGPDELCRWKFYGCDLDAICARMAAIQLAANCAVHRVEIGEILIVQGNTLAKTERKKLILHASSPRHLALAS
ncbi:SAM-dependent methyltransferase [Pseudomonas cichorii]|nr:SAM-dependent methyltransferase [Pseudomonas cichorii]MBX8592754.1 SAM-dependent methyltransferase [Pseudomonas cichorii]